MTVIVFNGSFKFYDTIPIERYCLCVSVPRFLGPKK